MRWGTFVAWDVSEIEWGSLPDWILAAAAVVGLATVAVALRDHQSRERDRIRQYAANVGVSAVKRQGKLTLRVKVTNGNTSAIYNGIVTVYFVVAGPPGGDPQPKKLHLDVLHPGSWEHSEPLAGPWIASLAEFRFTDGNGRRWLRDSTGKLRPSST